VKVLSKATVYVLRALVYVATQKERKGYISIGEISEKLDISFHFLTKSFQQLTQQGILQSYRGPNGGIALKIPAGNIFLIDIVDIIEGPDFFETCLLGLTGCGEFAPCPVHDFWKEVKGSMKTEFESTSLAELGAKVSEDRLRLSA
jgi:Rrf2 family protein